MRSHFPPSAPTFSTSSSTTTHRLPGWPTLSPRLGVSQWTVADASTNTRAWFARVFLFLFNLILFSQLYLFFCLFFSSLYLSHSLSHLSLPFCVCACEERTFTLVPFHITTKFLTKPFPVSQWKEEGWGCHRPFPLLSADNDKNARRKCFEKKSDSLPADFFHHSHKVPRGMTLFSRVFLKVTDDFNEGASLKKN